MSTIPIGVTWLVSAVLVEAAIIDGQKLKVPNWLTFHLILGGLGYAAWTGGWTGLGWSAGGAAVGLALLLPLYAIGGMGAGDVKLLAGVGAWMGPAVTVEAFILSALVGGLMALAMVARAGTWKEHVGMFFKIGDDILKKRNPAVLAREAAERKPRMMLLPYAIPLAVGSIVSFAHGGLLF